MKLLLGALMSALPLQCVPVDTTPSARGSCPQYEHLLKEHNPGWDVKTMSRVMWRESRCQPEVRSRTRDTGLLQINDINHKWLSDRWQKPVTVEYLQNPTVNVEAAAELFKFWQRHSRNGYQPWATTKK